MTECRHLNVCAFRIVSEHGICCIRCDSFTVPVLLVRIPVCFSGICRCRYGCVDILRLGQRLRDRCKTGNTRAGTLLKITLNPFLFLTVQYRLCLCRHHRIQNQGIFVVTVCHREIPQCLLCSIFLRHFQERHSCLCITASVPSLCTHIKWRYSEFEQFFFVILFIKCDLVFYSEIRSCVA